MSETPYTRANWNEDVIQEVNDLAANPDDGCTAVDPLDEVSANHIWTKTDITEVHDKLIEICPENEFDDLNEDQLWSQSDLLDPIEAAIAVGWCACTPEETIYDLGSYGKVIVDCSLASTAFGQPCPGEAEICVCGCYYWGCLSPVYEAPDNSVVVAAIKISRDKIVIYHNAYWVLSWGIYHLREEIETLESELRNITIYLTSAETSLPMAETQLAEAKRQRDIICSIGPGPACNAEEANVASKQAWVDYWTEELERWQGEFDEKTQEIAEKEAEIEDKKIERQVQREAWDEEAQTWWRLQDDRLILLPTDIQPHTLFPTMHEPWGDHYEDSEKKPSGYPFPKWKYYQHLVGHTLTWTTTGSFSPGGYPYRYNRTELASVIKRTCCESRHSFQTDCSCYAWKFPGKPCFGKEDSYRTPMRYYSHWIWYGWMQEEGCEGHDDVWQLSLEVFPAPDYTRPT